MVTVLFPGAPVVPVIRLSRMLILLVILLLNLIIIAHSNSASITTATEIGVMGLFNGLVAHLL